MNIWNVMMVISFIGILYSLYKYAYGKGYYEATLKHTKEKK